ncbi:BPSS1780 family membrane protein [Dokdonella sp.]|uniref:BPSS1780 family membrane protein n=1 Tax=Dokdonella sp. TaxID=2291710 RepID=UPI00352973A2
MSAQKIEAGSGLNWITGAVQLILKNPVVFLVMGLIVAAIGWVPVIGGLVMVVIGPALYGGIVHAAREQEAGRTTEIGQLFRAFGESGKTGAMIMLCLPSIAGAVLLFVLLMIVVGGALLGGGFAALTSGSAEALLGALGGGALILIPLALLIALVVYALQFFAIPRVMLDDAEPIAAMKQSFFDCLGNLGAYLVFVVLLMVVAVVLGLVLGILGFIGGLLVSTLLTPVIGCGLYLAWRQVYPESQVESETPTVQPAEAETTDE